MRRSFFGLLIAEAADPFAAPAQTWNPVIVSTGVKSTGASNAGLRDVLF